MHYGSTSGRSSCYTRLTRLFTTDTQHGDEKRNNFRKRLLAGRPQPQSPRLSPACTFKCQLFPASPKIPLNFQFRLLVLLCCPSLAPSSTFLVSPVFSLHHFVQQVRPGSSLHQTKLHHHNFTHALYPSWIETRKTSSPSRSPTAAPKKMISIPSMAPSHRQHHSTAVTTFLRGDVERVGRTCAPSSAIPSALPSSPSSVPRLPGIISTLMPAVPGTQTITVCIYTLFRLSVASCTDHELAILP